MFVGHYAASFAAKAQQPAIPLWLLFAASQLLDLLWALFLMIGIERVMVNPNVIEQLAFVDYPWTHSLAAAIGWSIVAGIVVKTAMPSVRRAPLLVGLVVLSHWFLDLIVHRADLPLWPGNSPLLGLGLWNHPSIELAIEILLFAAAGLLLLGLWRRRGLPAWRIIALLLFGAVFMVATRFAPPPPEDASPVMIGAMALVGYLVFIGLAWIAERPARR